MEDPEKDGKMEQSSVLYALDRLSLRHYPLLRACVAEFIGALTLVTLGCGSICQVYLGDRGRHGFGDFLAICVGWDIAIIFAVFFASCGGSGHINPAITLAFACIGKFPFRRVPVYMLSHLLGSMAGALFLLGLNYEQIMLHAATYDNNTLLLETTGNIFVTVSRASLLRCVSDQTLATCFLMMGILTVNDSKRWEVPKYLRPFFVGLLVLVLVVSRAMNTGCALNPARDLGPRIIIALCGWGMEAFTGMNCSFWVPIVGPFVGALLGAVIYKTTLDD